MSRDVQVVQVGVARNPHTMSTATSHDVEIAPGDVKGVWLQASGQLAKGPMWGPGGTLGLNLSGM